MVVVTTAHSNQRHPRTARHATRTVFGLIGLLVVLQGMAPCCLSFQSLVLPASALAFPCLITDLDAPHAHTDDPSDAVATEHPFHLPVPNETSSSGHSSHTLVVLLVGWLIGGLVLRHRLPPTGIAQVCFMPWAVAVPPPRLVFH